MKNHFTFLILCFLFVGLFHNVTAKAQSSISANTDKFHKNVYAELLGSSVIAGLSYDMRLKKGQLHGLGFRVGFGGINLKSELSPTGSQSRFTLITFPLEINHIVGKKRSGFVSGIGILPAYISSSMSGPPIDPIFINNSDFEDFGIVGAYAVLGYRLQPLKNGFMFQFNWNPLFFRGEGVQYPWFGLSLGYGFK